MTIDVSPSSLIVSELDAGSVREDTDGNHQTRDARELIPEESLDLGVDVDMIVAGEMDSGTINPVAGSGSFLFISKTDIRRPTTDERLSRDERELRPFAERESDRAILPPLGGQFAIDLAGDEAGSEAGVAAGMEMGAGSGEEAGDPGPIESPLQALLPYPDCLIYDVINEVCLKRLTRSRDEVCQDWSEHYEMNHVSPWSGDRSSCEVGSYHQGGVADMSSYLNLYRRHLSLGEVVVSTSASQRECALTYDIVNRDSLSTFNSDSACFTESRGLAHELPNKVALVGQWSLYTALHTAIAQTTFNQPLNNTLVIRQQLFSPRLARLNVGSRGIASCLQVENGALPDDLGPVISFPPAGENPFAIIKDGNHRGRVPWSIAITGGPFPSVSVTLFEHTHEGPMVVSIDPIVGLERTDGMHHFAFVPRVAPQAATLYELDIQWVTADEQSHHYKQFLTFGLCGLTQPETCQHSPDNCTLRGSHCSLVNTSNVQDWGCTWSGPVARGDSCAGLGSIGCERGICTSFDQGVSICAALCDPDAIPNSAFSCDAICPDGYSDQGGFGLCP